MFQSFIPLFPQLLTQVTSTITIPFCYPIKLCTDNSLIYKVRATPTVTKYLKNRTFNAASPDLVNYIFTGRTEYKADSAGQQLH